MIDPYNTSSVHLTVNINGQRYKFGLHIDPLVARDLTRSIELSDEPLSLMLASPSLFGGRGNAITDRAQTQEYRRAVAESITKQMVDSLMRAFGSNDTRDGYSTGLEG